jgi:hypothetical protein
MVGYGSRIYLMREYTMITDHQKKIAYAEGYHSGMLHENFSNPYEDMELRIQFNYGFRTANERMDSLYQHNYKEFA